MAHVIELWKDKEVADSEFRHLGDLQIHNQWVERPWRNAEGGGKQLPPMEFVANPKEIAMVRDYANFVNQDIVYILDKSEGMRKRMSETKAGGINAIHTDALVIQYGNKLYCVKQQAGLNFPRLMDFCCHDDLEPQLTQEQLDAMNQLQKDENDMEVAAQEAFNVNPTMDNAIVMAGKWRRDFVKELGDKCEECGYDDDRSILMLQKTQGGLMEFFRFGKIRSYEEIERDAMGCRVICPNCYCAGRIHSVLP
jgi:hypothetical protein